MSQRYSRDNFMANIATAAIGARPHIDLIDVGTGGLGRDDKLVGDLLVGGASGHQAQHFDLTRCRAGWPLPATSHPMAHCCQHRVRRLALDPPTSDVEARRCG